jgi:uncharacterized protein YecT (DUF1311 family)
LLLFVHKKKCFLLSSWILLMRIAPGLLLAVILTAFAHGARADCTDPNAGFDEEYCRSQAYQAADQSLNEVYQKLLQSLDPAAQDKLRTDELAWIRRRNKACTLKVNGAVYVDYDCVTKMTNVQTAALTAKLYGPAVVTDYDGTYTVRGTAMPWLWQPGGLNSAFFFGRQNGTGPTVLTLAGLRAWPGRTIFIKYRAGQASVGPDYPFTDAKGAPSSATYTGYGSTGRPLPSAYMHPYPIQVGSLVGAFTDASGQLVGKPFEIGDGPTVAVVPPGAAQLQLGIDDDDFADNSGSFSVSVSVQPWM